MPLRPDTEFEHYAWESLRKRIAQAREDAGMTLQDVVDKVNERGTLRMPTSTLQRLENGVIRDPRFEVVWTLCDVFNISIDKETRLRKSR